MTTINQGSGGFVSDHPILATATFAGVGAGAGALGAKYVWKPELTADTFAATAVKNSGAEYAAKAAQAQELLDKGFDKLTKIEQNQLKKLLGIKKDLKLSLVKKKLGEYRRFAECFTNGDTLQLQLDTIKAKDFKAMKKEIMEGTDDALKKEFGHYKNVTAYKKGLREKIVKYNDALEKMKGVFSSKTKSAKKQVAEVAEQLSKGAMKKYAIIGAAILGGITLVGSIFSGGQKSE